MALADFFRVLFGRKTEEEKLAEARFEAAMENHVDANEQIREMRERLQKARENVHDRIDAISKRGSNHGGTR